MAALIIGSAVLVGCGGHSSTARSQSTAHASERTTQQPQGKTEGAKSTKAPSESPRSPHAKESHALARAETICLKLNAEIAIEPIKSSSNREVAIFAPKNEKLEEQVLRELKSLRTPTKSPRAWQQVLELRGKLARELGELGEAAKSNDSRAVRELVALKSSTHAKLRHAGAQAGIKQCADVG